ncbi:Copper transport protein 86 [Wickerhamomyces ciferrii]|uniref:Ataxin-10 homolog n=1 Tax=Wickerhamomyces ciferrii (strain ATCC 14091 / BCRC 22168 / CBS 111 / JCM 3599 / NBRC 0793 / NRRL Y-1031 F-60-10) TaxID=1206466 RepID=K0KZX6_WICCF|nr:Copper transport protein 86 [Wickerhamomyces ciferrii]CCH46904.1 Copper transport protein 86 [Wickerhamomyces ciferrii]
MGQTDGVNIAINSLTSALNGIQNQEDGAQDKALAELSFVVKKSLEDESFREELAKDETVWEYIIKVISNSLHASAIQEKSIRIKRGVILLARNLLVADRTIPSKDDKLITSIFTFLQSVLPLNIDHILEKGCITASLQCVFNSTVDKTTYHPNELLSINNFLGDFKKKIDHDDLTLYFRCLNNFFNISEALTCGFKSSEKTDIIFYNILENFEQLNFQNDLSTHELLIISIFQKMIVHESFLPYISNLSSKSDFVRFLKASTVIITSKESWEVFELTVILSWIYELFQKTLEQIKIHFQNGIEDLETVYFTIHAVLDVFATLVKFEHAKKFLLSYKGVENLVELLGTIHQNVKPKKLKDSEKQKQTNTNNENIKTQDYYKNFPETKSLIIETLSSIIYKDFSVQELMRETHGLKLVLSNCIIDDNEPFIKERSIVCLRFLLLNNEKNQEFVAKLEAKEAVQDDTLDNAGFEVEIVDGKVKLKQKIDVESTRVQTKDENSKINEVTE